MNILDFFSHLELTRDLSADGREELALLWNIQRYSPSTFIVVDDNSAKRVFLVFEGSLEWYQLSQGKKIVLDTLVPGSVFGDLAFAHQPLTSGSENRARALTTAVVGSASSSDFAAFLDRHPRFALPLLVQLRNQIHRYESKIRDLAFSPADIRVINELIRLAVRAGIDTGHFYEFRERFTHEALAPMVGISRETFTRMMQTLQRAGFVEYTPDHRIRLNKKKIEKECLDCLKMESSLVLSP